MDGDGNSLQYDAIAGADGIPQVDLTAAGQAVDASGVGGSAGMSGIGQLNLASGIGGALGLGSIPSWVWIIVGAAVLLKFAK
jgi:hypothetical protein